jgi:hypothetical protein
VEVGGGGEIKGKPSNSKSLSPPPFIPDREGGGNIGLQDGDKSYAFLMIFSLTYLFHFISMRFGYGFLKKFIFLGFI